MCCFVNRLTENVNECLSVVLVRPTLDVIQKARSNMEHHLKETNLINSRLTNGKQPLRPQRTNGLD